MSKKKIVNWHGHKYYFIGTGNDGINYYLMEGSFECDWYWGFGYVVSFSNTTRPERSSDYNMWTHFDSLFFNKNKNGYDAYKEFIKDSPFEDEELWKLLELMRSFYTAREYSNMLWRGGSNYTSDNEVKDIIKSKEEYDRINNTVIPAIMNSVYKLLGGGK